MEFRPRDEDVVLCRSSGQVRNCVDEAEQQESLPSSILWRARPGPGFLLPPQNDLGFPWVGGVLLVDPLGILRVSVVCLLRSGEAVIAWTVWLEPDPGSVGQRLLSPGSESAQTAALRTLGKLAEEQRLLEKFHLALGQALRRPLVLVKHWEAGVSLSSMGEGSGHPCPNPSQTFYFSFSFCLRSSEHPMYF